MTRDEARAEMATAHREWTALTEQIEAVKRRLAELEWARAEARTRFDRLDGWLTKSAEVDP